MALSRSKLAPAIAAALVGAGAQEAGAELLRMPMQCAVRDGAVTLTPSAEKSYRIYGTREHYIYTACSPVNPDRCRNWMLHRFDVDCGGSRVSWLDVIGAAAQGQRSRAWVRDGHMYVQMGPLWVVDEKDKPHSKRQMWHKAWRPEGGDAGFDPTQAGPRSVVELPEGFAPVVGFPAQFVADDAPVTAAEAEPDAFAEDTSDASAAEVAVAVAVPLPERKADVPAPPETAHAPEPETLEAVEPATVPQAVAAAPTQAASETPPTSAPPTDVDTQTQAADAAARKAELQAANAAKALEQAADKLEKLAAEQAAVAAAERKESEPASEAEASAAASSEEPREDVELAWDAATTVTREDEDTVALLDDDLRPTVEDEPALEASSATGSASSADEAITTGSIRDGEPIPLVMIGLTAFALLAASSLLIWLKRLGRLRPVAVPDAEAQTSAAERDTFPALTAPLAKAIARARAAAARKRSQSSADEETGAVPPASLEEACKIVGASPDTPLDAVRSIVEALRESWHPDLANSTHDRRLHAERVRQIDAAWNIILQARKSAP